MAAELATTLAATDAERLEQAEALVRSYCGWHIAPTREETVTLRGIRRTMMFLPSLYVTTVSAITDDGTALAVDDDYTWSAVGVLTRVGYWSTGEVVVTFTHGYADPPPEVTAVVQAVAQRAVDNPGSLVREQRGPFAETYSQTGFNQSIPLVLLDAERETLRRYRIPALA